MSKAPLPGSRKDGRVSRSKTVLSSSAKVTTRKKVGKKGESGSNVSTRARVSDEHPRLLSGGNPQIAKGDGDGPVQAFIAAMSGGGEGWKRDVGRRLDEIVTRVLRDPPGVRRAVRWNSPFYGIGGVQGERLGWFMSVHCVTKYIKVAFFRGTSLTPMPPIASKMKDVRYFHIFEPTEKMSALFDEALFASWVRQAALLPGTDCF